MILEQLFQQKLMKAYTLAQQQGFAVSISIVDASGLLRQFIRMEDAVAGSIDVSIKKARTAALFGMNSLDFGQMAQPGGPIYSIESSNGGLISFGGGVVIYHDDDHSLIGAIGVAGATLEADQTIAAVAAA